VTPEDKVRRFIDSFMLAIPHLKQLGIKYHAHGRGWSELAMPYADHLVAYPDAGAEAGVVASGAIFTLMDSAGGFAVMSGAERMQPVATLDLRLDYLRRAAPGTTVIGRAEVSKMTRSVVFVRGLAHDGDPARPVANMTGTYMFTAGAKE